METQTQEVEMKPNPTNNEYRPHMLIPNWKVGQLKKPVIIVEDEDEMNEEEFLAFWTPRAKQWYQEHLNAWNNKTKNRKKNKVARTSRTKNRK